MVRQLLGFAILLLGGVSLLVILAAPLVVGVVLGESASDKAQTAIWMLRSFAPIILLSAWTVVGNAALNALGRSREAAQGQLAVPILAVSALVLAPADKAPLAAIGGMLLGTLINAVWVYLFLRWQSICLMPVLPAKGRLRPVLLVYRRLLMAAFLAAALVPLNYAFSAHEISGSVSAWALASKIVVLFSGVAGVGASAVVMPHLAQMLSHGARKGMRDDAHFLLVGGSWLGGIVTVGALLFSEPLVAAVLSGGAEPDQVSVLANIIKIGVLQVPVAIAATLVSKMAIVSGASSRVLFAAGLGFVCNLAVNLTLVPLLGVLGVAVGALSALVVSTMSLMLAARRQIGLTVREVLTIIISWLVWAGAGIAAEAQSMAALFCAVLAMTGLGWAQFRAMRERQGFVTGEAGDEATV